MVCPVALLLINVTTTLTQQSATPSHGKTVSHVTRLSLWRVAIRGARAPRREGTCSKPSLPLEYRNPTRVTIPDEPAFHGSETRATFPFIPHTFMMGTLTLALVRAHPSLPVPPAPFVFIPRPIALVDRELVVLGS